LESNPGPQQGEEEVLSIDFGRYLEAIRKYAWVIAAIVACSVTAAVVYTARQTKIYQATASVKIEPSVRDLLSENAQLLAAGGAGGEYYKQQLTILKSNMLLKLTVKNYALQTKLLLDRERQGLPPDDVDELATQRLGEMVKIAYPDQNRIMYVTVRSPDPKLAKEIANDHVKAYVAYSKGQLYGDSSTQQGALKKEFDDAEKELQKSEADLYKFQKDNDLLAMSLEDRQTMASANITSFTTRLNEARAKRIEMNARLTRMRKAAAGDVLDSPVLALSQSVALDTLKSTYFEERTKFAELDKQLGPKSPEYQMQKAKVDDLYASLQAEVGRQVGAVNEEYQTALATEAALGGEVTNAQQAALDLVPKIFQYNDLLRKKKTNEDKYNILVARLSNSEMSTRLNEKTDNNNVELLDEAREPTEPVSPKLRVNVLLAVALSLFFGGGLSILLAYLDRSVKSVEDAQNAVGAPVLGMIPILAASAVDDDKSRDLYVHANPKSPVAEFCRSLRTNILFSGADRELKTLVVSSANPKEGKTTTVIYLGTTMAQSNQRVLLIDTDMRKPRLHASLGVSRQKGLTNLIVGDENYDDVIKSTEIANLYLLPCGPLPPNPAELLMSKRFAAVLEELKKRFDRIILDSPPLHGLTDAVVLSRHTDGALLVVRAGRTLRDDARRASREIRSVNGQIVGVILNEFDMEDRRYGYYYRYGYYNYGETEVKEASQSA
jgi:succinoglycan biosynthesis transport protein ExoP